METVGSRMRHRFEFSLHVVRAEHVDGPGDATLGLLGSQGWEIRGIADRGGDLVVALQRPLDEDVPLPDGEALAASLAEPLAAPTNGDFAAIPERETVAE